MLRRPPRSTRTYTLFPTRRSSDLTVRGGLVGQARADLVAGGEDDFTGLGVDDIESGLRTAPVLDLERHAPAVFGALEHQAVIEGVEDFLARHAQRIEQAGEDRKSTRLNSSH